MKIIAIKIHYDSRAHIPKHLKYTQPPTQNEYLQYFSRGEDGKGGLGFHECMNFHVLENNDVQFYIPPGYFPKDLNEQYSFVWITYGSDPVLPWRIVGIHHNAKIVGSYGNGIQRSDTTFKFENKPLIYHGLSNNQNSTIFSKPLQLVWGKHIPNFSNWGNGLRYLTEKQYASILSDRIIDLGKSELRNEVEENEFCVLKTISSLSENENSKSKFSKSKRQLPDKELGRWGEELVYQSEIEYAEKNGIDKQRIEWISNAIPQMVYDIKSIRKINGVEKEYYIEVKTTRNITTPNIIISNRQIEYAKANSKNHTFAFVDAETESVKYITVDELLNEFVLIPEKYQIQKKGITNGEPDPAVIS